MKNTLMFCRTLLLAIPSKLKLICFTAIYFLLTGCTAYNALTNTFDDSALLKEESATIHTKTNLKVFAYTRKEIDADEYSIGNLKGKSKVPTGFYRLEVSIDKPGFGKSFVPVSLLLTAEKGKEYWVVYNLNYGFTNSWEAAIVEKEPANFYNLFEFWKKQ